MTEALQPLDLESAKLAELKIGVILNTASGSYTKTSASEMETIFAEYDLICAKMWCVPSKELERVLDEFERENLDVLVVLGGDGTIRSAAERCTAEGPYLIPLPGGTMNILPKALYGTLPWHDALRATLAAPHIKTVSAGEMRTGKVPGVKISDGAVSRNRFFIASVCGSPALWAPSREAIREGAIADALALGKAALDTMFVSKIAYSFNEMHEGTAEAVALTCPLVSDALEDDRQVFEAAVIDVHHVGDILQLMTAAALGDWRADKNIAIVRTKKISISSEDPIPMLLDGEYIEAGTEIEILFVPKAFSAIVPAPAISAPSISSRTIE